MPHTRPARCWVSPHRKGRGGGRNEARPACASPSARVVVADARQRQRNQLVRLCNGVAVLRASERGVQARQACVCGVEVELFKRAEKQLGLSLERYRSQKRGAGGGEAMRAHPCPSKPWRVGERMAQSRLASGRRGPFATYRRDARTADTPAGHWLRARARGMQRRAGGTRLAARRRC